MSSLECLELRGISLPDNRGWRWEEYPDPGMRQHGRSQLQQSSLPILVSTVQLLWTSQNLSSRLQPLVNNWSFVRSLLWIILASHDWLSFCLQPLMSGCPQICKLCLLASASHMNDCLDVCRIHECLSSCISHERLSCCLQPLTSSGLLYLSAASHDQGPPVYSLSQIFVYCIFLQPLMIKILLSAASHDWLSCCVQPLMNGCLAVCSLLWTAVLLSAASHK